MALQHTDYNSQHASESGIVASCEYSFDEDRA